MASQGLLFSEPSVAETGVWCNLSEGIDPTQWAMLCRYIGTLTPMEFERVKRKIKTKSNSTKSKQKCLCNCKDVITPLISIGPSGIGGQYQSEMIG
jgi:hypothetical protein